MAMRSSFARWTSRLADESEDEREGSAEKEEEEEEDEDEDEKDEDKEDKEEIEEDDDEDDEDDEEREYEGREATVLRWDEDNSDGVECEWEEGAEGRVVVKDLGGGAGALVGGEEAGINGEEERE